MKDDQFTLLTLPEVAKMLNVNPRTVFRMIHGENTGGKKLPAVLIGHSWRFRREDIEKYISENLNLNMPAKVKAKPKKKTKKK
jgi:excisionase family DNA binding protein